MTRIGTLGNRPRSAFTLVELLVAAAIALAVMGALASLFGVFSRTATNSQAIVELSARMRSTAGMLRQDLQGATAPLDPPLSPEADAGYFEIVEGPWTDAWDGTQNTSITGSMSILADTDDALLFTTRSLAKPFTGRFGNSQIESPTAEVAWFCRPSIDQPVPGVTLQTLYRRQLLVVSYVGAAPFYVAGNAVNNAVAGTIPTVYTNYDLSLRNDTSINALVPNTLADLGLRENRFFHGTTRATAFPATTSGLTFDATSGREGEDVVLTNVIAFDVRVFDPDSCPKMNGTTVVYPGDQGYSQIAATGTAAFLGAFIDIGSGTSPNRLANGTISGTSTLWGPANAKSGILRTYDTWTTAYESNRLDDDDGGSGQVDEGVNGVDDDADNIPDDPDELETFPPYITKIKAIEVRIRCFEPTSREIRQVTVRHTFSN